MWEWASPWRGSGQAGPFRINYPTVAKFGHSKDIIINFLFLFIFHLKIELVFLFVWGFLHSGFFFSVIFYN